MSKKNKTDKSGFVFSTDPAFKFDLEEDQPADTLVPGLQKLKINIDKKQRAGKTVTIVSGFAGTEKDLEDLGKKIKNNCGTGGTAKDGIIIIQGDQREKILQYLVKNDYVQSRKL